MGRVSRREIVDGLPRPSEAPALVVELAVALLVVASHALYLAFKTRDRTNVLSTKAPSRTKSWTI